uniref:Uncharacterized protein n=1 Tax=Oryza nivara TaxID=4536 RepID=A0A0E0ICC8_ORYNI
MGSGSADDSAPLGLIVVGGFRWGKRSKGAGGVAGKRLRAAAGIGPTGGTRVVVVLRVADCRPSHHPSSQPRSSLAGYRPLPVAPASSPPPKAAPALFPDRPPDAPAAPALFPCWPCSSRGEEYERERGGRGGERGRVLTWHHDMWGLR